jgi:hypothetical protein
MNRTIILVVIFCGVLFGSSHVSAQDHAVTVTPGGIILESRLKSLMVDKVDFNKADVEEVVRFLQAKSKELAPDHKGFNFVLRLPDASDPAAAHIHREVTISLDNIAMIDLLDAICQQTNLQCSVESYAVYLRPATDTATTTTGPLPPAKN